MENQKKESTIKSTEIKTFKKSNELTGKEILAFPKVNVEFTATKIKNQNDYRYSYVIHLNEHVRLNDDRTNKEMLSKNYWNLLTLSIKGTPNFNTTFWAERPYRLVKGIGSNGKMYYAMQVWFNANLPKMIFIDNTSLSLLKGLIKQKLIDMINFEEAPTEELTENGFMESTDDVEF